MMRESWRGRGDGEGEKLLNFSLSLSPSLSGANELDFCET